MGDYVKESNVIYARANPNFMQPGTYTIKIYFFAPGYSEVYSNASTPIVLTATCPCTGTTVSVTPPSATLTCTNPSTTLTASGTSTYAWTGTGGFTATSASVNISTAGTYTVIGTTANGCTASTSVVVTDDKTTPTLSVTPTSAILTCASPSTTLTASGGNTYAWTGTGGFSSTSASVNISTGGTFIVTATGTNGCTASASVMVTNNIDPPPSAPTISPTGTVTLCYPSTNLTLTASGCTGGTITWNTSPTPITGTSLTVTQAGSFSATCTTVCGTSSASATTTVSTTCVCLLNSSLESGTWSSWNIWSCGHVPLATEPVQISPGHSILLDINGTVKSLNIQGMLRNLEQSKILHVQGN
jgi:hypothetical protein